MSRDDADLWRLNRWQFGAATFFIALLSPVAIFDVVFLADMPVVLKLLAVIALALFGVANAYVTRWAFRSRRRA